LLFHSIVLLIRGDVFKLSFKRKFNQINFFIRSLIKNSSRGPAWTRQEVADKPFLSKRKALREKKRQSGKKPPWQTPLNPGSNPGGSMII